MHSAEFRVQSAVSRQKQLITVSAVANAQKQGVAEAECIEASDTTMFQELVQSLECRVQSSEFFMYKRGFLGEKASFCFVFYSFVSSFGSWFVSSMGVCTDSSSVEASSHRSPNSELCTLNSALAFSHSSYSALLLRSKSRRRTFW